MNKIIVYLSLILLLSPSVLPAGQGAAGEPGAFMRLGVGARALALGGAFTAVANDVSAGYWNPAGLADIQTLNMVASRYKMSLDRTLNYAALTKPIGRTSSVGVSWIGFGFSGIEARSGDTAEPDYTFASHDNAFLFSYGKKLSPVFSVGTNMKLIYQKFDNISAFGTGFDISTLVKPMENVRLGFSLLDIGTASKWSNNNKEKFPVTVRGGIALDLTSTLVVALDVDKVGSAQPHMAFGIEHKTLNALPLRFGYSSGDFVGGAGIVIPLQTMNLDLDYAYGQDALDGSQSHKISLGVAFLQNKAQGFPEKIHRPVRKSYFEDAETFIGKQDPFSNTVAIEENDEAPVEKQYVEVKVKRLRVRKNPGSKSQRIGVIKRGQTFRVIDNSANWYKLAFKGGKSGWVYGKYIEETWR